ncbi:hypothetical protein CCACVL1_19726 [Corchorus capsularis]|uniref:Uncharacterized protein n=1 Tax=Corchorus capsularis TaxID=210143 RepID=A0A1R3HF99_COCAP|nr:hypothetical protein CCACVL1_19726 [Corchorus capsularis]
MDFYTDGSLVGIPYTGTARGYYISCTTMWVYDRQKQKVRLIFVIRDGSPS